MLSPLEPCEDTDFRFVVCDIETYAKGHKREGDLIAIDTAWRSVDGRGVRHVTHYTWLEWWDWLVEISNEEKMFRVVYAHNGGGFDWLSLAECLLRQGRDIREKITASIAGSKMVTMSVQYRKGHNITLCDSLQLLRSKLAELADVFLNKRKLFEYTPGEMPHDLWEKDPSKFRMAHRQDTEILLEVMEHALEHTRKYIAKIGQFGFTIGSTAIKVFRTAFQTESIMVPESTDELRMFLRNGYRGGRVECFRPGRFDRIKVYDINSLYPFAMRSVAVPITDRGCWSIGQWNREQTSISECTFTQRNRNVLPILMHKGSGCYAGSGTFFGAELNLLLEVDPKAELKIHRSFTFTDTEIIFKEFVDRLYAIRLKDKKGPLSLLAKYLMNSLYGKFGQHSERTSVILDVDFDPDSIPEFGESDYGTINRELGVFSHTTDRPCNFEHVGIAGMITSFARCTLYRGLLAAGKGIVYCDTDSIHTTDRLPAAMVGRELGQYKLEFEGEGVYAGKKLYALRNEDTTKIRAKGVRVRTKRGGLGCRLTFEDMARIVQGKKKVCEFEQFPSPLEVMSGKCRACKLISRKRTLRKLELVK